jgi:hypothetical protein
MGSSFSLLLYFSERTSAEQGQNGPETSEALSSNDGGAHSESKADRPKNPGSEIDSLPSTSPDGKNCRSQVRQKQRTYSGPIMQSGLHNSLMTERGHIVERCV